MKVLVVERDIYGVVGGGQTAYRRLFELNPTIDFFYFSTSRDSDSAKPTNVYPIRVEQAFVAQQTPIASNDSIAVNDIEAPFFALEDFVDLWHYLKHARGQRFDVIDFPDYFRTGYLLRPMLEYLGIQYGKIALAMHGSSSVTLSFAIGKHHDYDVVSNIREYWQFVSADVRYAISAGYADEWGALAPHPIFCLDPLLFLDSNNKVVPYEPPVQEPPVSLSFVGRLDRLKGPDIFLELLARVNPDLQVTGVMIGDDVVSHEGESTAGALRNEARARGLSVHFSPSLTRSELFAHYRSRTVVVLPSRYDTLNLVALEAFFSGCPLAIGKGAKIIKFLRERFPALPFVEIDTDSPRKCISALEDIVRRYDSFRQELVSALSASDLTCRGPSLESVYRAPPCCSSDINVFASRWVSQIVRGINGTTPQFQAQTLGGYYAMYWAKPEVSEQTLTDKLKFLWQLSDSVKLDRVRVWREMARLEMMRGNDLLAATYQVRGLRALGSDRFSELSSVTKILRAHQYAAEARVLEALYGPPQEDSFASCGAILAQTVANCRSLPHFDYEIFDDRRSTITPKVSVIVSLYGAAGKLPVFLRSLEQQTLGQMGNVELVLVDSGSPTNEYEVFSTINTQLSVVYVRSRLRETIQSAWNRGISVSRGEYLCFLGVDETLTPQALESLAAELDTNPSVDWVMGNSTIVNVDPEGNPVGAGMKYDRSGYEQGLVYLDTSYLSWVGGLYRRAIHSRFGYYDASFRAAGDTEFKGRVMPFISSKALPQDLGIFLNYPEERTTESPMAEIEDIRAWYLHRSEAGVEFAMNAQPVDLIVRQIRHALSYRKSFKAELSTDFDYALPLLRYLERRSPQHPMLRLKPGLERLVEAIRSHEYVHEFTQEAMNQAYTSLCAVAAEVDGVHRDVLNVTTLPYKIFNDNRYEQHFWPWKQKPGVFFNRVGRRYRWG